MRITGRRTREGEMMPKWYGLAYYEPWRDEQVVYLIPFNLLVRWWKDLRWFVKTGKESALHVAYSDGYNEGRQIMYDVGFDAGVQHGKAIMLAELREAAKNELGITAESLEGVAK